MSAESTVSRNPLHGLRRFPERGVVAGVCEGVAVHFDWNVRAVRVVTFVMLFVTGFWPLFVSYLLAWYIVEPASEVSPPAPRTGTKAPAPGDGSVVRVPMPELKARFGRLEERLRAVEACVVSDEYSLRRELRKLEG